MSSWPDKLDIFVKVAGAVAAVYAGLRFAFKMHKRIASGVATEVESRLSKQLDDKLEPVLKELRPNGGTSLADQVQNVLTKLEHHSGRVRAFNWDTFEGMFEADKTGSYIWVNRTYCRIMERTESEVLGWGWLNTLHPDEADDAHEMWLACVAEARECMRVMRYITPDGEEILCNVRARPIKDSKGNLLSYMGFVRRHKDCSTPVEYCPVRKNEERNSNAH